MYHASVIGLAIGGYDTKRGNTEHCIIVNNTFYQDKGVELLVRFNTRDNIIENNIVVANSGRRFLQNIYPQTHGNIVDHNLYYAAGGGDSGSWQGKGTTYRSFRAYVRAAGNDTPSMYADPPVSESPRAALRLRGAWPASRRAA